MADRILQLFNFPHGVGTTGWRLPVRVVDTVSTDFPTGSGVIIDGVSLVDSDYVLFTNLTDNSKNDRIYKITGVGTSIIWTLRKDGQQVPPDGSPTDGDTVYVREGLTFAEDLFHYDGTKWFRRPSYVFTDDLTFEPSCTHNIGAPTTGMPKNIYVCKEMHLGLPVTGDNRYSLMRASGETTDNSPLNMFTHDLNDNSVYEFEFSVSAANDSGTEFAVIKKVGGVVKNPAASAIIIEPGIQTLFNSDTSWSADWTIAVSGDKVELKVTGETGKTINWKAIIKIHEFRT